MDYLRKNRQKKKNIIHVQDYSGETKLRTMLWFLINMTLLINKSQIPL